MAKQSISAPPGRPPMNSPDVLEFRHQLLHEQVAAQLRDMIIEGELQPDAVIDELALCARFAISRTPLREALKVLAAEELVVLLPRRGAVVSKLTGASVAQKFEVVTLLECHALRSLCERNDDAAIAELVAISVKLKAAFPNSRKRYHEANQLFHRRLVELTGNNELIRIHGQLLRHLQRARYFTGQEPSRRETFMAEHDELMTLLNRRRWPEAEAALRRHLEHVARAVLEAVGQP